MPTKRIDYVPQPFVPDRFVPQYGATLGALLRQASENRGLAALQSSRNAQLMWQSMGEGFRRFQDRILQDRMLKERASMDRVEQDRLAKRDEMAAAKEAREAERQARMDARMEQQDERLEAQDRRTLALDVERRVAPGVITSEDANALRGYEGTAGAFQVLDGVPVRMPTSAHLAERERAKQAQAAGEAAAADRAADNARQSATAAEAARHNRAMEGRGTGGNSDPGPLEEVIGPDGQPVLVARPDAVGKRRPTSGQMNAQDRQRSARVNAANDFLTRLNELREKINTKMGPAAGVSGMVRRGSAALGMDPDVAEYERIRAAGGRALAVAIMGAQNLSDADAKSWSDMLPGATVDRETAKRLTDQVSSMLSNMSSDMGADARPKVDTVPDLSGLKPGVGRKFRDGPFAGQTWTLGPDGKPKQVQ